MDALAGLGRDGVECFRQRGFPPIRAEMECPRQESNLRTRFRKPLLYPLSYGGRTQERSVAVPTFIARGRYGQEDPGGARS